jgi:hypothetical protein
MFSAEAVTPMRRLWKALPRWRRIIRTVLSFPDPTFVYSALAEDYYASFNQPFFGDEMTVSLTADDLSGIYTSATQTQSASLRFVRREQGNCSLTDASALPR